MKKIIISSIIIAGIISTLVINKRVEVLSNKFIYQSSSAIPAKQAALILGARVWENGQLSAMLADRVLTGAELYKAGKVKKILISGDHGRVSYDEVNSMRNYLLEKGVPKRDIFMDHAGFDTYDSLYRARDVFHVKNIIIVTQKFHLPRAIYIAKKLGIDAVGLEADRRQYVYGATIKASIREILARVKAFNEIEILRSKPKYLGKVIPVEGDGRQTEDAYSK